MLLYATMLICAGAIGAQVYRYDMYDREPPQAILLTMIGGAIALWAAGLAQVAIISSLGTTAAANFNVWMAFAAGTTEELGKISVVALIAILHPRWFNDPLDGAIYGAFAGLGAAVYESFVHIGWPSASPILPASEPVRLLGHLLMGGIGGCGVGFVRITTGPRRWLWLLSCLLGAMVLHTAWDVIAFEAADLGRMLPWHTFASILIMLTGMVAFRLLVRAGAEHSRVRYGQSETQS